MWLDFEVVAVVEYVISITLCKYLTAVPWTVEEISLLACDYGCGKTLGHKVALAVAEYSCQLATSAHKELVGVVVVPAGTHEHIPKSVASVQIAPLEYAGT